MSDTADRHSTKADGLANTFQSAVGAVHRGIDLFLFQQGLDTSTPSGRAMFQMLGVFSEFEAAMIRERVRTGVARAKRNGTKSGKPIGRPRLAKDQEVAAKKMLGTGIGILKVARTLKIGTGTVSRIAAQLRP